MVTKGLKQTKAKGKLSEKSESPLSQWEATCVSAGSGSRIEPSKVCREKKTETEKKDLLMNACDYGG
jgi:hypothetical protein